MPRRRSTLAFLSTLLVQLLLLPLVRAQILSSSLPACASSCTVLQQAQSSCETNPSSAESCFCQSSLLAPIKTSSTNLCAAQCNAADWATIASWYKTTCANGGTNVNGVNTATTTVTTAANGATTTATTSSSPTVAASSNESSDINQDQTGTEWWQTHWQWIVMVIVLVLGFTAIGVGGRFWYRRHHKKVDGEIVEAPPPTQPPDMGMWAPSRHSVHDFSNTVAAQDQRPVSTIAPLPTRQPTAGKGKQREGAPPMPGRTPSQRLKKAMESVQM